MAIRVLDYWKADVCIVDEDSSGTLSNLASRLDPVWLEKYEPNAVKFDLSTIDVTLRYDNSAAITGDSPSVFSLEIFNPHPEKLTATITVTPPDAWQVTPAQPITLSVEPKSSTEAVYSLNASGRDILEINSGTIRVTVQGRPELLRIPLVFLGGTKWLVSPLFVDKALDDDCGVVETHRFSKVPSDWNTVWRAENDLEAEVLFQGKKGVIYLLHHIHSEKRREVMIGVANTNRMRIWLNGEYLHETKSIVPLRPNQGNGTLPGDGSNYAKGVLNVGWNQVLIKLERGSTPIEAHFTIGLVDKQHPKNNGGALLGVSRNKFIWEA